MSLDALFSKLKGSSTSGNYGHSGRPGKRGGSSSSPYSTLVNSSTFKKMFSKGVSPDEFLSNYFEENGYNAKPQKVDDLDAEIASGDKFMYRGIQPTRENSAEELIDQYKNGEHFIGYGMYGRGTYTAHGEEGEDYAKGYGVTFKMTLDQSAKEISYRDADDLLAKKAKTNLDLRIERMEKSIIDDYISDKITKDEARLRSSKLNDLKEESFSEEQRYARSILSDPSVIAALSGYDAITTKNITVVLNRGKVKVQK